MELCDLRFDQVTFPGSHSAGSGFDGIPRECDGSQGNTCVFPTQSLSITEQLELGIRYLTLDICFLPQECDESTHDNLDSSRLVACRGSETDPNFNGFSYGGSLVEILRQVDEWMRNHRNEVIGIHFTRNVPTADRSQIFSSLIPVLESKWGQGASNASATQMSTFYETNSNTWPTLGKAVVDNQRIFIFADQELIEGEVSTLWKNPSPYQNYEPDTLDRDCNMPGIEVHALRCSGADDSDLIIAVGYTLAICIRTGQMSCNNHLQNASNICYGLREAANRTVNVVLVDFPQLGQGTAASVFNVTRELNDRNIERFRSRDMAGSGDDGGGDVVVTSDSTLDDTTSSATNSVLCSSSSRIACSITLTLFVLCSALHSAF